MVRAMGGGGVDTGWDIFLERPPEEGGGMVLQKKLFLLMSHIARIIMVFPLQWHAFDTGWHSSNWPFGVLANLQHSICDM